MSKRGFVYVLANEHMHEVFKVGCTERSPHERAAELSNATGVPAPFDVLCYIEVEDFQAVEKRIHTWVEHYRISPSREFFTGCLESIVRWMFYCPYRLAFCDATVDTEGNSTLLMVHLYEDAFTDLENPWVKPPAVSEPAAADDHSAATVELKLVSNGEAGIA